MSDYLCYGVYCVFKHILTSEQDKTDYFQFWVDVYKNNNIVSFDDFISTLSSDEIHYLQMDLDKVQQIEQCLPYYRYAPHIEVARRLLFWYHFKKYPQIPASIDGYGEKQVDCDYMESIQSLILHCLEKLQLQKSSIKEDYELLYQCIHILQPHGIHHLLGFRHTIGSLFILYPPRQTLIAMFNQLNKPNAKLTVGARALSKHSVRCKHTWGELRGPEIVQNEIALSTLYRILEHCIWINIHLLPHNIPVLEIRIKTGFGCRWDLKDHFFRGFVEPYMENGFEVGWVHNTTKLD